jgi:hypothetical protein
LSGASPHGSTLARETLCGRRAGSSPGTPDRRGEHTGLKGGQRDRLATVARKKRPSRVGPSGRPSDTVVRLMVRLPELIVTRRHAA